MIASLLSRVAPPPNPSAVSASPSSCRPPVIERGGHRDKAAASAGNASAGDGIGDAADARRPPTRPGERPSARPRGCAAAHLACARPSGRRVKKRARPGTRRASVAEGAHGSSLIASAQFPLDVRTRQMRVRGMRHGIDHGGKSACRRRSMRCARSSRNCRVRISTRPRQRRRARRSSPSPPARSAGWKRSRNGWRPGRAAIRRPSRIRASRSSPAITASPRRASRPFRRR